MFSSSGIQMLSVAKFDRVSMIVLLRLFFTFRVNKDFLSLWKIVNSLSFSQKTLFIRKLWCFILCVNFTFSCKAQVSHGKCNANAVRVNDYLCKVYFQLTFEDFRLQLMIQILKGLRVRGYVVASQMQTNSGVYEKKIPSFTTFGVILCKGDHSLTPLSD